MKLFCESRVCGRFFTGTSIFWLWSFYWNRPTFTEPLSEWNSTVCAQLLHSTLRYSPFFSNLFNCKKSVFQASTSALFSTSYRKSLYIVFANNTSIFTFLSHFCNRFYTTFTVNYQYKCKKSETRSFYNAKTSF